MTRFLSFPLLLLIFMAQEASPYNRLDHVAQWVKDMWDTMDGPCLEFCERESKRGILHVAHYGYLSDMDRILCDLNQQNSPFTSYEINLRNECKRVCNDSCYHACFQLNQISCPYPEYRTYFQRHGYRLTTTTAAPTTSTTTEIGNGPLLLEMETEKSSSSFLGEPGSVKFWISISAIIFFSIVIIILIIACVLSAASKERNRIQQTQQVAPESDSASSFAPPVSLQKPKQNYEKPPIRVKSPQETEGEIYSKPVTPIRKGPEVNPYTTPMPTQQQQAYQLVPMSLPGQAPQFAQGQQPMVIMLPANYDFSGGTPVLIPISGNAYDTGGTAATVGQRRKNEGPKHTKKEADDDDD